MNPEPESVIVFRMGIAQAADCRNFPTADAAQLLPMALFRLLQAVEQLLRELAVAAGLAADDNLRMTSGQLLQALHRARVVPDDLLPQFQEILTTRNVIAHGRTLRMTFTDFSSFEANIRRIFVWYLQECSAGPRLAEREAASLLGPGFVRQMVPTRPVRRVFLCYAKEDREAVAAIYERLKARGHMPWMDVKALVPGQEWEVAVRTAIREADVFIACLSPKSVTKRSFLQKEIRYALEVLGEIPAGQIYLIPLRLEPCDVPTHLRPLHWLDWDSADAEERLCRAIEHLPEGQSHTAI